MYMFNEVVEIKDPQARKWVKATIQDISVTDGVTAERPSGKVVTVPMDKVRKIDADYGKITNGPAVPITVQPTGEVKPKRDKKKGQIAKTGIVGAPTMPASADLHADLQRAFDHFNSRLFNDELPEPFWTTIRQRNVLAHYAPKRWVQGNGGNGVRDEIMINPDYMVLRGMEDFLSSIVHEMCHQEQQHHGTPPRAGYHDAEWAAMMETVGLIPTSTGGEYGKKTGQKMDHRIEEGGRFAVAAAELIEAGFSLSWQGAVVEMHGIGTAFVPAKGGMKEDSGVKPPRKPATRVKFECGECGQKAWAKPTAALGCVDCKGQRMEPV